MGSHGNLAIISGSSTPVNVSFTCSILRAEIFQNKVGLTCALVCLETGQNVYTVLDDLDLPTQQNESQQKKSIFRKAKDNIMLGLSDHKLSFFGSKRSKQDPAHQQPSSASGGGGSSSGSGGGSSPNVPGGGAVGSSASNIGCLQTHSLGSSSSSMSGSGGPGPDGKFTVPVCSQGAGPASVKFQSLEEFHCRGELRKVKGRSQFSRHATNKLDVSILQL